MKNIYVVTITDKEFGYTNRHYFTSRSKAHTHLIDLGFEALALPTMVLFQSEGLSAVINKHEVNR